MKKWETVLVSATTSLEDAIGVLDRGGLRIVLVADDDRRLLGTITDGDVRRALIGRKSLTVPVSEVMCRTPRSAMSDWTRDQILAVMEDAQILHLPVVTSDGSIIGLETLHDLLEMRKIRNPVFLMAGGFGKRLHPLTHDCPKPLLKIGDKPILELIIESFIESGFYRFYISTHFLPEMIRAHFGDGKKWGVNIQYVHEEEPLGTGGALGLLPHDEIDLPLIMMNGDVLTRINHRVLLEFHQKHDSLATMCVREYENIVPYGVITSDGHRITGMVEKPVQKFFINAGIYVLSPDLVRSVKSGTRVDMPTLLEQSMEAGAEVTMFPMHEYWLDIGRKEDFDRAQRDVGSF